MNGLREKFRNKKGFTLIEMLIVVAIIAILIAISIPIIGSALETAREATDAANERAFKGEIVIAYMLQGSGMDAGNAKVEADSVYAFDAANGKVVAVAGNTVKAYGQGTTGGKDLTARQGNILYGSINKDGIVSMGWAAPGTTQATVPTGTLTSELVVETKTGT